MADITFIQRIQLAMSGALKGQMHLSAATLLPLTNGDYFEVWAKANDNNRILTIQTLRILIKL